MKWLFAIWLLLLAFKASSQQDTINTQHLSSAWIRYENNELIQSFSDERFSSGGFFLISEDLNDQLLRVCGQEFDVWVNSRLVESVGTDCRYYETDQLVRLFKSDTLYFTVASENFRNIQVDLLKVEKAVEARYQLPVSRQARVQVQVWLLFLVFLLLFMALFKVVDEATIGYLFSLRFFQGKLETDISSVLSLSNIFLMILLALLVGFQQVTSQTTDDLQKTLLNFFGVSGIVWLFLLAKVFLIRIIGRLFRFYRLEGAQIREYLFFTCTLMLGVTLVDCAAFWFFNIEINFWLMGPAGSVVISVLFLVWVFSRFPKSLTNRKLHIISYLCSTEFLPTFVLANWLLN